MHARKTARDALFPTPADDGFFAPRRGDIVFRSNTAVRTFADRLNRGENRPATGKRLVMPAELAAMSLVHQVLHAVIGRYRDAHPSSFPRLARTLETTLADDARWVVVDFLATFPPPPLYRALRGSDRQLAGSYLRAGMAPTELEIDEELLLLWITNQNAAYDPVKTVVSDQELGSNYRGFIREATRFFEKEPPFGPRNEKLVDLLLAPGRVHPTSILAQLDFIERSWAEAFRLDELPFWSESRPTVAELRAEEGKWIDQQGRGPGPGEPLLEAMRFGRKKDAEPANFSPDLGWMPNVVLIAKSVYVWLEQLSQKYQRHIYRIDQIPDEELDLLASRKITSLWLIGLFERSPASRKMKRMHGDSDALASAYSLASYEIARDLGGVEAYENLKARAWQRGLRLAADMVPNHVGVDAEWVMEHPDWFLQTSVPPFPAYRFGGPDLSEDPRAAVVIDEGYWDRTDAAVVFRRIDRRSGDSRYIYHGNDGTSTPWNDTAQLDYLNPAVRHAVIETILHVARLFPIIRFDAAMTLAKRHIQRLWYPIRGQTEGAIPSRSDFAMTPDEFDAAIPVEFWREVVDAVAARAPDTLLLAEAFWMMEGYFVRTLGMHRVYNSAFMNMLKREENDKYRDTIKNVLDFDPEILKRFVNFMNNPDEETAVAQFGQDDRYFGVCTLMCTMPGLPMFGHGQIEGLREKYGMEYARARWNEQPNEALVQRHEREIFPLLEKRYLFSGVANFALYDFIAGGSVDEDVYAYSNRVGDERALVLFNNRFKNTRGRVLASTHRGSLAQELGLDEDLGWWLVIRDVPHGLEYLRPTKDLIDGGMSWELLAFQYHVFTGFRHVMATLERPYDRLALELDEGGVPDIERAVRELYLRPIHAPLRNACSQGHVTYLSLHLDPLPSAAAAAHAALEERLGHVADGLDWMLSQRAKRDVTVDRAEALAGAVERFDAVRRFVSASRRGLPEASASTGTLLAPPATGGTPVTPVTPPSTGGTPVDLAAPVTPVTPFAPVATPSPAAPAPKSSTSVVEEGDEEHLPGERSSQVATLPALPSSHAVMDQAPASSTVVESSKTAADPPPPSVASPADASPASSTDPAAPVPASPEASPEQPVAPAAGSDRLVTVTAGGAASVLHVDLLLAWIQLEAVLDLLAGADAALEEARSRPPQYQSTIRYTAPDPSAPQLVPPPDSSAINISAPDSGPLHEVLDAPPSSSSGLRLDVTWEARETLLDTWELATPLVEGFETAVSPEEARRRAALVLLASLLPPGPLAPALRQAIGTKRGQAFVDLHESDGVLWLNKERFEELARFLEERELALGHAQHAGEAARAAAIAEREGYRAERIAARLGPLPRPTVHVERHL